jgi:DNA-binding winged helix-turn-helix (wHTH) protein/tetratricopeptide (TPR) repeat protein
MKFDDIDIDPTQFELRRGGELVSVEPKVFDLIHFLAKNANRLITKDELIEEIWDGRIVSDAALSTAIKSARRAMGETNVNDSRIRTVRGRGFRMVLPDSVSQGDSAMEENASRVVSGYIQPSFAIVTRMDSADGISGEVVERKILRAVARVPFVTVLAPSSAQKAIDGTASGIGGAVGPGFVFEISGRYVGNLAQLDCLLFEIPTGVAVWNYESPSFAPSDGLEETLVDIAIRLEPQLVRAVCEVLEKVQYGDDARVLALKGLGTMSLRGWNKSAFSSAEATLQRAVDLDDTLPYAHAALSLVMALGQQVGLATQSPERLEKAIAHAERAIELDGIEPNILGFAGCALCDAGQGLRGRTILQRALNIDANNPQAQAALGAQMLRDKELVAAIEMLKSAVRAVPRNNTLAVWGSVLAQAHLMQGDTDAALAEATRAVAADDRTHLSRIVLVAVYLARGELDAARQSWDDTIRVTPELTPRQVTAVVGKKYSDLIAAHLFRENRRAVP